MEFVSWDDDIPFFEMENHPAMFETTYQPATLNVQNECRYHQPVINHH